MTAALVALLVAAAAHSTLDPVAFFTGKSQGAGTLKIIFQSPKTVRVESEGKVDKDGALTLRQVIREPDKKARTRTWTMREIAPGRYTGSLSDAAGPVDVIREGDAIRIRYTDKDNLAIDQRLTLAGPRTVHNRMKVRRFGIVVATLDETIRKVD